MSLITINPLKPAAAEESARKLRPWIPDFFIVGAMKCGTTTLHHMLARHPRVFIPRSEIFFFDIDDIQQHPNFFAYENRHWRDFDFERDFDANLAWYQRFFASTRPDQLIGEDSTTYLASPKAATRIHRLNPDARIIVMLRDPTERAYSAYWHLLRGGRALFSFEDTLRYCPEQLIDRSLYRHQIQHYVDVFGADRVHVVLLEELVAEAGRVLAEVSRFLGLDQAPPFEATRVHSNRGSVPRFPRLAILRNRALWRRDSRNFFRHLPEMPEVRESALLSAGLRLLDKVYNRINPLTQDCPPMRPETRSFLNALFARENRDLDALVGKDLAHYWKCN
jgi:hypothetical protein